MMKLRGCLVVACLVGGLLIPQGAASESGRPDTFDVDASHSSILFKVKHLGVSYTYGRFNEFTGSFAFDEKNPSNSALEIEVKTKSIDTGNEGRDKHLRSSDFFSAKQFPVITIKSKSIQKLGTDKFEVSGDLTLHGVKKPLTVTVNRIGSGPDPWGGYRMGFETDFKVKRSDFGMSYGIPGVGDEIQVIVSIEGVRQ